MSDKQSTICEGCGMERDPDCIAGYLNAGTEICPKIAPIWRIEESLVAAGLLTPRVGDQTDGE